MSVLFVANAGGHLKELLLLSRRLTIDTSEATWVTFDSPQAHSLLTGQNVRFIHYPRTRDTSTTIRNLGLATKLLRSEHFDWAFSTGAGVAVSFLPAARLRGISCHYIESATRVDGPSMSGKLLQFCPGIHLYTQDRHWSNRRWQYGGSVFDGFKAVATPRRPLRKIVVTVGSSETFSFRRLISKVASLIPLDAEVLWQTGETNIAGLTGRVVGQMPALDLEAAMRDADVVIAHAGVGTAISALESGRRPLLVPREMSHGEHVDNHQFEVAAALAARGLALTKRVDDLTYDDIAQAAGWNVIGDPGLAPFVLQH